MGLISHCPASFHSKLYSHHLPIRPILDRKFQTLHLADVYKRQPLMIPTLLIPNSGICTNSAPAPNRSSAQSIHAVSYTHLDVYKRQVQAQIVVVLYGEMVFMEIAFQNSCRLCSIRERKTDMQMCIRDRCSIRERKTDMLTAFLLQLSKAFFFQQRAVVDNSNICLLYTSIWKNKLPQNYQIFY